MQHMDINHQHMYYGFRSSAQQCQYESNVVSVIICVALLQLRRGASKYATRKGHKYLCQQGLKLNEAQIVCYTVYWD